MLDAMARRYGKLPTDIMELTVFDLNLNIKIMSRALDHERMLEKKRQAEQRSKLRTHRR
jgi:hypothetical protein